MSVVNCSRLQLQHRSHQDASRHLPDRSWKLWRTVGRRLQFSGHRSGNPCMLREMHGCADKVVNNVSRSHHPPNDRVSHRGVKRLNHVSSPCSRDGEERVGTCIPFRLDQPRRGIENVFFCHPNPRTGYPYFDSGVARVEPPAYPPPGCAWVAFVAFSCRSVPVCAAASPLSSMGSILDQKLAVRRSRVRSSPAP